MTDAVAAHIEATVPNLGLVVMTSQPSSEENLELINLNKTRFRRRLKDRWHCQIPGHIHCFTRIDGTHLPLTDEALELWVSALHDGEATLLIPPKGKLRGESDEVSIASSRSSNVVQYQRPFRWQCNPSLTDLRSMRMKLHNSILSSSTSAISTSTGSSGVPGIGYLSGKAVKWAGEQILNAFIPLEISRRRRAISGLIRQLENIPEQDRAKWMFNKKRKIDQAVEDLLELTTEGYKTEYQRTSIIQAKLLYDLTGKGFRMYFSEEDSFLSLMEAKLFPLVILSRHGPSSEALACNLREMLLQDSSELFDEGPLITEMATQLCFQLAYGTPSPWYVDGYAILEDIYRTPHGRQSLLNLGQSSHVIDDLAAIAFTNAAQRSVHEPTAAVNFFARYSNDVPKHRVHLHSPGAIPLLVKHLKAIDTDNPGNNRMEDMEYLARTFMVISKYDWCVTMLLQCDIYPALVSLLIFSQRNLGRNKSYITYYLVWTLRDLAVHGGVSGRHALLDATTDDLKRILPQVGDGVRRMYGNAVGKEIQEMVAEIWR